MESRRQYKDRAVDTDAKDALQKRVTAVLNTGSGSCDETSADKIKAVFDAAGLTGARVVSVGPDKIEAALDGAVADSDVVVALGGDGTIRTAAIKCGEADVPLIPLPGGTMNMLPKSLFGEMDWEQALAATLAEPRLCEVSGGLAEDQPFFCVAILGAPTLWADARESLREGHLSEAFERSLTALKHSVNDQLDYQFGESTQGSAEAVAVICPLVSRVLSKDEPGLEAAALDPETAAGLFRLTFHAVFDDWRLDPSVERAKVKTVRVTGHGPVPVILDGETVQMKQVVNITFRSKAFRAIAPAAPA